MTDAIARVLSEQRAEEFDAVEPGADSMTADPHPRLAGYRVTDLDALAGAFVWLAAVGAAGSGLLALGATLVIVVTLALIAVGITFSPLVEVVAVALFTVAVAGFALLTLAEVVPDIDGFPAVGLGVASLAIVLTMALALAYGYSAFPETGRLVTISEMIRWHGSLNAFGFALPALLALRRLEN